jgi:hypothetical protein
MVYCGLSVKLDSDNGNRSETGRRALMRFSIHSVFVFYTSYPSKGGKHWQTRRCNHIAKTWVLSRLTKTGSDWRGSLGQPLQILSLIPSYRRPKKCCKDGKPFEGSNDRTALPARGPTQAAKFGSSGSPAGKANVEAHLSGGSDFRNASRVFSPRRLSAGITIRRAWHNGVRYMPCAKRARSRRLPRRLELCDQTHSLQRP